MSHQSYEPLKNPNTLDTQAIASIRKKRMANDALIFGLAVAGTYGLMIGLQLPSLGLSLAASIITLVVGAAIGGLIKVFKKLFCQKVGE